MSEQIILIIALLAAAAVVAYVVLQGIPGAAAGLGDAAVKAVKALAQLAGQAGSGMMDWIKGFVEALFPVDDRAGLSPTTPDPTNPQGFDAMGGWQV